MCKHLICLVSFILLVGLAVGAANADIQTGLVGYWPLNEGAGDTAADMSGNGHDGTLNNGATWISPGFIGNGAVNIDGNAGSRVSVGDWDPGEQLTLAIWVRWTGEENSPRTGIIGKRNGWSAETIRWFSEVVTATGQVRMRNYTQTVSSPAGALTAFIDEWAHVAITFDGTTVIIYLNGEEVGSGPFSLGMHEAGSMGLGCKQGNSNSNLEIFSGDLDEARIYNRPLSVTDVQQLFEWTGIFGKAYNSNPDDGQTDVPRDIALGWTPGEYAPPTNGHKLYFSENFNDISDGVGGATQDANSYTPPQRLDFGTTYYWRVDEVNGPPDNTVFEGNIWSFTTEPFAYAVENITATASSSNSGDEGPEKTFNGSGLDADDLHSVDNVDMWLSSITGPQPTWIQYEFDRVYKLHQMSVWNHNSPFEQAFGLGVKDATIEHSVDGATWTTLGTTHEFTKAPGAAGYAHNTMIDFGDVAVKYVKITANSNWGGIVAQYGLSEVRFLFIPVQARKPNPAFGSTDMNVDNVTLVWRAGREAADHDVFFSSDIQTVTDETISPVRVPAGDSSASYDTGALDLNQTYYWKVNEVNEAESPATWQGDVWNFTTQEYLVVDDFESYNDIDEGVEGSNRIYNAWIDGLIDPAKGGSTVGHLDPPFYEETIVHGGSKSMPLYYDNAVGKSEATLTLINQHDWTVKGVNTLTIWYMGDAANVAEPLYVALNGNTKVDNDNPDAALSTDWTEWNIDLQAFGINLANVNTITLGLSSVSGGAGIMYFDDIRLYAPAP
ncbi:MAG: LamG-like jellyroll fold domain-containing protein [Planctomycetota bacterium]|jgi:hypothetical protein